MGISQTYINIIEHPAVDATINFIKKFKSSKSYWSVSYFILLFTIREAIAWKFGSAIKTFCEEQVLDSSFPTLWEVLGFVLDVGGSWELVALGTFVFVVLSLVRVAESEGTSVSVRENYLTLFLLVFVGSVSFYQNDEMKEIVEDIHEVVEEIKEDTTVNAYLVKEITKKDVELNKHIKAIKRIGKDDNHSLENIKKILEEEGIDKAILSARAYLSYFENQRFNASQGEEIPIREEKNVENFEVIILGNLMYENTSFMQKYTWDEGNKYCRALVLAGYSDWRLPQRYELNRLFRDFKSKQKWMKTFVWTSESINESSAWVMLYGHGATSHFYKSNNYYVRCVR